MKRNTIKDAFNIPFFCRADATSNRVILLEFYFDARVRAGVSEDNMHSSCVRVSTAGHDE